MNILKEPIITEKMTSSGSKLGQYGFIVDKKANKIQIKKAVEEMYGVRVEGVNTMNYFGKKRSRNTKSGTLEGKTSAYKKAVVKLADGDSLDFFSSI